MGLGLGLEVERRAAALRERLGEPRHLACRVSQGKVEPVLEAVAKP